MTGDFQVAHALTYPDPSTFYYAISDVTPNEATAKVPGSGLPYRYIKPKNWDPAKKYPLIIFLHGAGEGGNSYNKDNAAQITVNHGNGSLALVSTANPDNQTNYPCFFVAPQSPNSGWSTSQVPQFMAIINGLVTKYGSSVDTERICFTGLSAGSIGLWQMLSIDKSNLYGVPACVVLLSGSGGDGKSRPGLPMWVFHASNDTTVGIGGDDTVVYQLRSQGEKVIYTRYNSGGHGIWPTAYATSNLMPWIYAQRLGVPTQGSPSVVPNIVVTSATRDTKLNLTATAPSNASRVGWASSAIGNGITKSDGILTNGTTFGSQLGTFTSAWIGYRIGLPTPEASPQNFYDVSGYVDAHTLTLASAPNTSGTSALTYTAYPPGGPKNPQTTLTNITPAVGFTLFQAMAEMPNSSLGGLTSVNEPFPLAFTTPTGDTTAPSIALASPTTGTTYTTAGTLVLSGTASDNSGTVTVTWTSDFGYSGTASLASGTWTISNVPLIQGDNTLHITAADPTHNAKTITLVVTYTGTSANLPPEVDAGTYKSIVWPLSGTAQTTLAGAVQDDDLPGNTPTWSWSKVSGPGSVSFGNAASLTSTVNFSQPGTYVLRLTAHDGALDGTGDMTVTVLPRGTATVAIDSGNTTGAYTATNGTVYSIDNGLGGSAGSSTSAISGTNDQPIYQNWRVGTSSSSTITYALTVPNGTYDVVLHFVELLTNPRMAGQRVFNAVAEGQTVATGIDVYKSVKAFGALDYVVRTTVNDGQLNLSFIGTVGYPAVAGLAVYPATVLPPAPVLTGAVSRMTQGAAGSFDLALPLTGNPAVEGRRNAAGSFTAVLTFDKAVTGGTVSVSSGTATVGAVTASGNALTVPLTSVADLQTLTLSATGVTAQDGGTGGTGSVSVKILRGDVSGDKRVDVLDMALIKARSGQTLDATTYRYDMNADGAINVADMVLIQSLSGHSVP